MVSIWKADRRGGRELGPNWNLSEGKVENHLLELNSGPFPLQTNALPLSRPRRLKLKKSKFESHKSLIYIYNV